ncbi:hypothetical protein [Bacillus cereus group sp. BfR-BA-01492]|uniref:hypothetical protein n=1 Tax=Bacillus cereus group sp. BfR-BA-01492 TaxID=2920361 RepID=UPI001F599514|nr:hypothetical protein [Bacillus cereus group sp. BfR-BA-01492]
MVAFFTFTSRHNREEVTMPNAKRSNDTSAIFYFVTQRLYFLFNSTNSIFSIAKIQFYLVQKEFLLIGK